MVNISERDFAGTRCRVWRLRDDTSFCGWIDRFDGQTVTLSSSGDESLAGDEEYRFEGFGNHIAVSFIARPAAPSLSLEGQSDESEPPSNRCFHRLTATGKINYSVSPETVRWLCKPMSAKLAFGTSAIDASAIDVGPNGIGILMNQEVEPDTTVVLTLESPLGQVKAQGFVRYCRISAEDEGQFRAGLMLGEIAPNDRPTWDRYLSSLG